MRYYCYICGKSVTSEIPENLVIRAVLVCPECIEQGKISILEHDNSSPDPERAGRTRDKNITE